TLGWYCWTPCLLFFQAGGSIGVNPQCHPYTQGSIYNSEDPRAHNPAEWINGLKERETETPRIHTLAASDNARTELEIGNAWREVMCLINCGIDLQLSEGTATQGSQLNA
ncbi:Hypothetical predicted protein, partial [Pelobates cultripes]